MAKFQVNFNLAFFDGLATYFFFLAFAAYRFYVAHFFLYIALVAAKLTPFLLFWHSRQPTFFPTFAPGAVKLTYFFFIWVF